MKKYPYLDGSSIIKKYKGQMCSLCPPKTKATHRLTIQTNWFRGDDDVFWVCENHLAAAKNAEWKEFYKNECT